MDGKDRTGEELYLEGMRSVDNEEDIFCPVDSCITIFLVNFCRPAPLSIHFVDTGHAKPALTLKRPRLPDVTVKFLDLDKVPDSVQQCCLPAVQQGCLIRAGLCAVLRNIVKTSAEADFNGSLIKLLGYKEICLKSCAEVSVWTKFCEVEMPRVTANMLDGNKATIPDNQQVAPELLKLENHFRQPAIIPNVNKKHQDVKKKQKEQQEKEDKSPKERNEASVLEKMTQSMGAVTVTGLEHIYAEGTEMTLTDLVLYPCLACMLNAENTNLHGQMPNLPRIQQWYRRMSNLAPIREASMRCGLPIQSLHSKDSPPGPSRPPQVLNCFQDIRDPNKKKVKANIAAVAKIMDKLQKCGLHVTEECHPCGSNVQLPWKQLPSSVHPSEGELPASRVARKCEQLENLANAVLHIAAPGDVIVDFCSGGGHLGILLAHLLPHCQVALVENKEESILRALKRINDLKLTNVQLYQCNMDYYMGKFNVGVCLHACGVATDLVLQRCLDNKASFVICPCCYGGIQDTHTMTYPRSAAFKDADIHYKDYVVLGHAADQTQVGIKQALDGKRCMLMIDTDRSSLAREHGYKVALCSLHPLTCSPKNNLLIGTRSSRALVQPLHS